MVCVSDFVEIVWLCTDYADLRVHVFGDEDAYKMFGKEFHMVTSSHRGDLDWVAGFILGAHYKFLHVRMWHWKFRCLARMHVFSSC